MKIIRNTILIYLIGFAAIFGLRYLLGGSGDQEYSPVPTSNIGYIQQDFSSGQRNIISAKRKGTSIGGPVAVDQKFEQVANVATATRAFEDDETQARAAIKSYDGLIQFEQRAGLEGYRSLQLAIGIAPENFDVLVSDLKGLGTLTSFQIDKTDKTNEYRDLQARKISLEKSRDSLLALKAREGKIDEMINLENQVLGLEQQIQALGVNLGDFDSENEFSTVKLTLAEIRKAGPGKSLARKLFDAAIWTLQYYTMLLIGLAATLVGLLVLIRLFGIILGAIKTIENNMKRG